MIKRYTTEAGSVYTIDFDKKTWARVKGKDAESIRSDSGVFIDIDIGFDVWMLCPAFNPDVFDVPRIIESTMIVKEEVIND